MRLRTRIQTPRDTISSSDFDPNHFYLIQPFQNASKGVSAGIFRQSDGNISVTDVLAYSSGNWQLYHQNGRYFIRNYDYANWQLGVTPAERSVPRLYPRNGSLGQQWTLARTGAGGRAWRFSNGLLGNGTWLGFIGEASDDAKPAMSPSESGADWDIVMNESAGKPRGEDLFQDVDGFEFASTASASSSSSSSTLGATPTSAPTSLASQSSFASQTPFSSPSPSSVAAPGPPTLGIGAIVGIAVGGLALLVLSVVLTWFVARRRQRESRAGEMPAYAQNNGRQKKGRWAYFWGGKRGPQENVYGDRTPVVEIGSSAMIFEAQEKGHQGMRHEMG